MDVDITSKKQNPLLSRQEIQFAVRHVGEETPTRESVRETLAARVDANKGLVVVDRMNTQFGRNETEGYAKVYDSVDALRAVEHDHLIARNDLPAGGGDDGQATAED